MVRFAVIAAVWLTLAGCSTAGGSSGKQKASERSHGVERVSIPDSRPHIMGIVTEVKHVSDEEPSSKRILVEENPEGCIKSKLNEGCDKLYLDVTGETRIFRKVRGEEAFAQVRTADLQRGQKVHAWHTGVLKKSYPGQGHARVIVIDAT
jgi:hypothetical protein